jgi:hypothetical protein
MSTEMVTGWTADDEQRLMDRILEFKKGTA